MKINLSVKTEMPATFRVEQLRSIFDVPLDYKLAHEWKLDFPFDEIEDWHVGAIVGPSGSGKSSIAQHCFGDKLVNGYKWPRDKSILDGFAKGVKTRDVVEVLNSVGFSSPPSWCKPFRVLSNGEKFRVTLARAIIESGDKLFVFDEFTSVVDRTVAKVGSHAVAKAIRRRGGQIVAVSCHYDILSWLEPDWILDLKTQTFTRRRLRRPKIKLEVYHVGREVWPMFKQHHYLSGDLAAAAKRFGLFYQGEIVGFAAVMSHAGHKGFRRVHRIVILPDFQGVGFGKAFLDILGEIYREQNLKLRIVSSHPGVVRGLSRAESWRCAAYYPRGTNKHEGLTHMDKSRRSLTPLASFEYRRPRRTLPESVSQGK